ncbi:putative E3 ubiquitin-protein ligase RHA4A [Heracleum sosnowskyi]|uniref:RING-type E3 ubiquitin transferase n=1 Tax=Heracleum sosnowskyi TaxID=360622 RepID=A0AAD8IJG6_9APIA|nr:putative E3 ubiquitin-protein ligase RHA4A [Heracleum sosnowskyi]
MSLYLLHLKKKASALSYEYPPPLPPTVTETPSSFIISVSPLIDKLPTIVFDEEFKARDSVCCVCLGEFEMKEELIQVPSCKHIFHNECIRNWLISSTTCPLCRCSVIVLDNNRIVRPHEPQTSHAVLLPAATSIQLAATS